MEQVPSMMGSARQIPLCTVNSALQGRRDSTVSPGVQIRGVAQKSWFRESATGISHSRRAI